MIVGVTSLVQSGRPQDDNAIDGLRARLAELGNVLEERAFETVRAKSDLAAFRIRYKQDVGMLHEELDELDRAIAEAELGEIARLLDGEGDNRASSATDPASERSARYTSDAVRRLFRDVAKTIHPDLARDPHARGRRHHLMVEANRAYALGDEERLRSILEAWEKSPEAVNDSDPDAERLRLERRIGQMEEQLIGYDRELEDLKASPLWRLKVMVDDAAGRGKDLVADMVRRLKRDIVAARNRLDAMRWNP
jgi:hypothetical protein